MTKPRECKDCRAEGRTGPVLNAPFAGPRCFTHDRAKRRADRERELSRRLVKTYGITLEQWRAILEVQGGGCAWCGRKPHRGGRRLAVDHDHSCCPGHTSCGRCVRGGCCWSCNKHLQHLGDDPDRVERGAEYLRNPPARVLVTSAQVR